jgi:hypothetical protein
VLERTASVFIVTAPPACLYIPACGAELSTSTVTVPVTGVEVSTSTCPGRFPPQYFVTTTGLT